MYARVTLLEIDTVRTSVDDALEQFRGRRRARACASSPATAACSCSRRRTARARSCRSGTPRTQAAVEGDHQLLRGRARPASRRCSARPPGSRALRGRLRRRADAQTWLRRAMRSMFGLPRRHARRRAVGPASGSGVALVAALALRNVVFFRLGVRNVGRRAGRSALIVVGLMLATTIIAAALGTGDTMGRTVRSTVLQTLGNSDEWITVKGAKPDLGDATVGGSAGDAAVRRARRRRRSTGRCAARGLVDGVDAGDHRHRRRAGPTSRQTEPRVDALRARPGAARRASARSPGSDGRPVALGDARVRVGVLSNRDAADALGARRGDTIVVLVGGHGPPAAGRRHRDVPAAPGPPKAAMLHAARRTRSARSAPRARSRQILVSNRGGETTGVAHTDAVVARLRPVLVPPGLEAQPVKRDGLEGRRRAGQRVHADVHHLRQLLDRGRHPADLPDLRDARGRAPHRDGRRARDRHAARPPRRRRSSSRARPTTSSRPRLGAAARHRASRSPWSPAIGQRSLRRASRSASCTRSGGRASSSRTRSACC